MDFLAHTQTLTANNQGQCKVLNGLGPKYLKHQLPYYDIVWSFRATHEGLLQVASVRQRFETGPSM